MAAEQQLADARAQLHLLLTGQAAVRFRDSNGEMVDFAAADADRLAAYVRSLEAQIGGVARRAPHTIRFHTSKGF